MAIYTRTGDDGTTGLFGGKRLSKADIQVDAYGCVDELTSIVGFVITNTDDERESLFMEDIQRDLYVIMGLLANAPLHLVEQEKKIRLFEKKIDELTSKLPPLTNFILPGGSLASCWAHMARVSCRKAERAVILFLTKSKVLEKPDSQIMVKYLNRLSDLMFTYARALNDKKETISKKI